MAEGSAVRVSCPPRQVLLLIDNLGSGGAQRQLVNLAVGLTSRGHRVRVLVYYPGDFYAPLLREAGVEVVYEPKASRYSVRILARLRRHLLDPRYDLVLSFLDTPNVYAEICGLGRRRAPVVVSERYCALDTPRYWATRQLHRLADWITTNSHHQRLDLEHRFPFVRGRISTIYNGVDTRVFSPPPSRQPASGRPLELLVVSSVSERKNGRRLVEAFQRLHERYRGRVILRWAGAHNRADPAQGQVWDQLRAKVVELGLESDWHWLGERGDIPDLMRTHDALVHPSHLEGLPNAICEALACGLPVLASRALDHPRLVQEGVSGELFDPHDADDIARVIGEFAASDDRRRRDMGIAARAYAERELSIPRLLDRYETLLAHLTQ
jgi:glycosyltransferase involved in cell wall biosynthesis